MIDAQVNQHFVFIRRRFTCDTVAKRLLFRFRLKIVVLNVQLEKKTRALIEILIHFDLKSNHTQKHEKYL